MKKTASQVCAERIAQLEGSMVDISKQLMARAQEVKTLKEEKEGLRGELIMMKEARYRYDERHNLDCDTIARLVKAL